MKPSWWYHCGSRRLGSDPEEPAGVVPGFRDGLAGPRIDQGFAALRVALVPFPIPLRRHRVIQVVSVGPGVVAEVALIGPVVHLTLPGPLRNVVLDGQVVDPDLAPDPVLAGMVDNDVLNDLDASLVRRVDEVLVGRVRRLQPRIDPGPVVAVVTVIVQPAAVLDRRGDPDSGEAQVLEVVQLLDQAL